MNIKLSIQRSIASGSRLMLIIHIHLIFYLLECIIQIIWINYHLSIRLQMHGQGYLYQSPIIGSQNPSLLSNECIEQTQTVLY